MVSGQSKGYKEKEQLTTTNSDGVTKSNKITRIVDNSQKQQISKKRIQLKSQSQKSKPNKQFLPKKKITN